MSLRILGIRKTFGPVVAVDNFTLTIQAEEFLVVLGPSGCGKTTVLRLIAGLEPPDGGTISMNGEDWTGLPPQKRDVAMVFQQYALYPQRTVRGNIEYPLRLRGMSPKERQQKVEWISSLLGIASLLNRKPRQLSGGEAQRVALARALVREPAGFLMDEPLSNLDAQLRLRARAEIKRLQRELKVTTLYVTHDQEEAVTLADRIAIMNEGRLVQVGTAEELFQRPATSFVAMFLGKPPMNLLRGRIVGEEQGLVVVELDASDGSRPRLGVCMGTNLGNKHELLVGFRPDHIKLLKDENQYNQEKEWSVSGKITLVEGLEPDYLVHCDTPIGTLLVRTRRKPTEEPVQIRLPATRAHYFDVETGNRLE